MSQTHHRKGSSYPPLKPDTLRLYSMFFCPYAQRTRLVLAHKNIPYENVNVNLMDKPDWLLARNPMGLVPMLERNDRIVYESTVCGDYLDELYPENPLVSKDPYKKAQQKMLMERFGKVPTAFFALMRLVRSDDGKDPSELLEKLKESLQPFEDALKDTYFGGSQLSMLDLHAWPFIERFSCLEKEIKQIVISPDKFPKLHQWVSNMKKTEPVKKTIVDGELHMKLFIGYAGGNPDYDALMKESKLYSSK